MKEGRSGRPEFNQERAQVFYVGDDGEAKAKIKSLIESTGFKAVDAGPLSNARYLEPIGMLNI